MGRIKTKLIKRKTREVIAEHTGKFKEDFDENKKLVSQFVDVPSKKLRNVIAGYVTRLMKKTESE